MELEKTLDEFGIRRVNNFCRLECANGLIFAILYLKIRDWRRNVVLLRDLDDVVNSDFRSVVVDVDDADFDDRGIHLSVDVGRRDVKLEILESDLWKRLRNENSCKRIREITSKDLKL